ncbi:MAG: hypothetical protein ABWW66_02830 [Archaeoglobaceae archaeon]
MKIGVPFLDEFEFPPSLVIVAEEVGAGGREFLATSVRNVDEATYVAIAKTEEQAKRDIQLAIPEANFDFSKIRVVSLAKWYFRESVVPLKWVGEISLEMLKERAGVLEKLVEVVEDAEGYIYLDSINDLAKLGRETILDVLRGLRVLCFRRNIMTFALLTLGIDASFENAVMDQGDGVIVFELEVGKERVERWMFFRKFPSIVPRLEREGVVRYNIRLDPKSGVVVSRIMRVL